jgi:sulfur-oxidizing protein SoxX
MERPLSNQSGDPKRGETIVVDSKKGNCLICHVVPIAGVPAAAFGDLGPSLQGVGSRLTVPQLRQRVVNPRMISPETVMPAYFETEGLTRVQAAYVGKTILSAEDVEDVVAYLASLK